MARGRRLFFCLLFTALWLVFFNAPALAHKVMIFAWVEGDTIHTQSKFSGGKRVKGAQVLVFDSEGNQLLEGKTDEQGAFSFKVPKKTDLKVVLRASMGHMAEWKIPAEEITAVGDVSGGSLPEVGVKVATEEAAHSTDVRSSGGLSVPETMGLSRQEVEEIINKCLDRKLTPIIDMLVNAMDRGPKVTEVIGGIGYIFGLVGVALYFANRRKRE
ncbi:MAG: hypothetical protein JRJ42_03265 [Deltaproteobacteria bacterium]|nr:hypothetical protein [Deltaproteobacteria bacterium]MBW2019241.1 hypothetical protein [Deltaproteobacteria bacterium]MBW2074047.1 hypothetical protein [Deltaproteobacteria bacterium]RLB82490.1 MAG: hypothetical protein DRH17_05600 [Deltaproteobacteria bacterium]